MNDEISREEMIIGVGLILGGFLTDCSTIVYIGVFIAGVGCSSLISGKLLNKHKKKVKP